MKFVEESEGIMEREYLQKIALTLYDNDFGNVILGLSKILAFAQPYKLDGETDQEFKERIHKGLEESIYPMYILTCNLYEYTNGMSEEEYKNHITRYMKESFTIFINEEVDELLRRENFSPDGSYAFVDFTVLQYSDKPVVYLH
jgi:hypothetical protein